MDHYENMITEKVLPAIETTAMNRETIVKVAILDTGLDAKLQEPFLLASKDRLKSFKNFAGDREDIKTPKDSTDDDFGHGTHATKLLLLTAPIAEIYVARVAKDGELGNPMQIYKACKHLDNKKSLAS